MANAVFDAVRTVLAVREYQDKPIPNDVLGRIAEAGRLTASASNRQPWHFVFVTDRQSLQELGRLVQTGPYISGAAAAVVVAGERPQAEVCQTRMSVRPRSRSSCRTAPRNMVSIYSGQRGAFRC